MDWKIVISPLKNWVRNISTSQKFRENIRRDIAIFQNQTILKNQNKILCQYNKCFHLQPRIATLRPRIAAQIIIEPFSCCSFGWEIREYFIKARLQQLYKARTYR